MEKADASALDTTQTTASTDEPEQTEASAEPEPVDAENKETKAHQ